MLRLQQALAEYVTFWGGIPQVEDYGIKKYMDYFRDVASGVTYRVTSNPEEREAPKSAGATIRGLKFFTAERKDLPK